jgi:hypothetical protein
LSDPVRPWWRRTLRLEFIGAERLPEAFAKINEYYVPPPPAETPAELRLRVAYRKVAMTAEGIVVGSGSKAREYRWIDVRCVEIEQPEPLRRDFSRLVVMLPDRELNFAGASNSENWQWWGASCEEVVQFVARHVPAEQIEFISGDEPPKRYELIERRLQIARNEAQAARIMLWFLCPLALAAAVWCAWDHEFVNAVAIFTMFLAYVLPLTAFTIIKQQRELARWQRVAETASRS